jgi:hypothetical protein
MASSAPAPTCSFMTGSLTTRRPSSVPPTDSCLARAQLTARQFSRGEARVGRLLRERGFVVRVGDSLTAGMLVNRLAKLRVYSSGGLRALYQPITLPWAFARTRRGEPRLVSWIRTQPEVSTLLASYGRPGEGEAVYYPIAALHGTVVGPVEHAQALPDDSQMIKCPASSMNEKSGRSLSLSRVPGSSRSYGYGTGRVQVVGDRELRLRA